MTVAPTGLVVGDAFAAYLERLRESWPARRGRRDCARETESGDASPRTRGDCFVQMQPEPGADAPDHDDRRITYEYLRARASGGSLR